jgi:uncharacterized alkaline shock family protein YloU
MKREDSELDFGAIKIHKKAIAEIVLSSVKEVEGVSLLKQDFLGSLLELGGGRRYPGISVAIDKSNQVSIAIKVKIRYGLNVQEVARHVQDVVRNAIEKTVDIDIKDIHVIVYGIERGEK